MVWRPVIRAGPGPRGCLPSDAYGERALVETRAVELDRGGRYAALDSFRFIAATGVMVFHYSGLVFPKAPDVTFLANLRHMVDFFFILSGFVIMNTYGALNFARTDLLKYISKRLARLYPLHFVTLLFFIAYGWFRMKTTGAHDPRYDPAAIVPNLLMIHAWGVLNAGSFNFPSWSISSEWFVYLLFPLALAFFRRTGAAALLLLGVAVGAALTAYDVWSGSRTWTLATYDWGALRAVPSFFMGMAINVLARSGRRPPPTNAWPAVYLLVALVIVLLAAPLPGEIYVAAFAALIYVTARAVQGGGRSWLASKPLTHLGDASYSVYMLHLVAAAILFGVVDRYLPHRLPVRMALGALGIGGTVIAALASYRLFEVPARDWMRARLYSLFRLA